MFEDQCVTWFLASKGREKSVLPFHFCFAEIGLLLASYSTQLTYPCPVVMFSLQSLVLQWTSSY